MTRAWTDPTTPTETVMGAISCGGITEMALIAKVMHLHQLTFPWAETAVKNAITELAAAGRIEQIAPGVSAYQIPLGAKMEPDQREKTTRKTVRPLCGYDKLVAEAKEREGIK